jgi:beta-lactamase regulating signal transducer with metallopeptidase domain
METISGTLLTFLLNALWQVPIAWAVAALACRLMPNGPARYRHAVWVAALFAALLSPALSVRTPQRAAIQLPAANLAETAPLVAARVSTPAAVPAAKAAIPAISFSHDWAMILLGAYGLFAALRAIQLLRALYRTFEIRRDAAPGDMPMLLARCQAAFSAADVRLLRSRDVAGPVALHRAIILPDEMFAESREEVLATALGHEMAHIARHDFLWKVVYELLYLPLSFHPAAILVRRGIENTREMACDELVTHHLLEPAVYARSIMTIAGAVSPNARAGYALGVFDGDILEERIRSLMERRGGDLRRARIALTGAVSVLALCLVFASGTAVTGFAQSAAQSEMQTGADARNRGDFAGSVEHFQNAVNLEPANVKARLFLGHALIRQAIAEKQFLDNDIRDKPLLAAALGQYREVLAIDPVNAVAMLNVVALTGYNQESRAMMLKLIVADPGNKDAYYTLGVIDWSLAYGPIRDAYKSLGVSPAVRQLPDPTMRANLRGQLTPYIDEGLRVLQIALEKDPTSSDTMAYLNLIHRERAMLAESTQESDTEVAVADSWVGKALDAKRAQARQPKAPDAIGLDVIPPVMVPAPPPPPPPPPPGTAPKPRNPAEGGR